MSRTSSRELARRFRDQQGVISRSQLYALGVSRRVVQRKLATGEWEKLSAKAVRLSGSAHTPEQDLFALFLTVSPVAVASHQSAAWLWRFAEPPERHAVTVPRSLSGRATIGELHRPKDFPAHIVTVRNIPCTDPLRTLVDVAAVTSPEELEAMVDKALASKLVSLERLAQSSSGWGGKGGGVSVHFGRHWAGVRQPSFTQVSWKAGHCDCWTAPG